MVAAGLVPYLSAFTRHAIILMGATMAGPLSFAAWHSENGKPKKLPFHLSIGPVVVGVAALLVDYCLLSAPLNVLHINTVAVMGFAMVMSGMRSIDFVVRSSGDGKGTIEWSGSPSAPLVVLAGFCIIFAAFAYGAGASGWGRDVPTPLPPPADLHPVVKIAQQVFATLCILYAIFSISNEDGTLAQVWGIRALLLSQLGLVYWEFGKQFSSTSAVPKA
ncbi:hypothetical protein HDU87_001706 [Geranomyces variabilis]|uniref:Uncharacterized protein n=1 Tax=Geranomyces variabilis TaxID=109894 RepID=A0AAD5XI20_9FUNG|nr:hypothetical protein HDU87_001706 [Geranomyces variabilis]